MRGWAAGLAAAVGLAVAAGPASAEPTSAAAATARQGIAKAVAAGRIKAPDAARYRASVRRAASLLPTLPPARAAVLGGVLRQVASFSSSYTAPRALTLFSMLDVNSERLSSTPLPTRRVDVQDADGVTYRWFAGSGFQFHPLADFAALSAVVAAGDSTRAERLATALVARGIPDGPGLAWEYEFRFGGGRPPWTSGMAQAVAAVALARTSRLTGDLALMQAARRAYAAIPGRLVRTLQSGPGGQWIRLYSFSDAAVLNAQLQAAVALAGYAAVAGDGKAASLAASLTAAAKANLSRFDTGYWSTYSLANDEAPLEYQTFVTDLLARLAAGPSTDPFWKDALARFRGYLAQPPALQLGAPAPPVEVTPGKRGRTSLTFWLSKRSTVALDVGATRLTFRFGHGWHTVPISVPAGRPSLVPLALSASDLAGNRVQAQPLPVAVLPAGAGAAARTAAATAVPSSPALLLGGALDPAMPPSAATAAGLQAVRLSIAWPAGAAAPDPVALAPLQQAVSAAIAAGLSPVVAVVPSGAEAVPVDDSGRAAFAAFAANVVAALPGTRALVVGDEPNQPASWSPVSAAGYAALLGATYDAVKAVDPSVTIVGGALSDAATDDAGASSASTFLKAMGAAYRKTGRTSPLMDDLAVHPVSIAADYPVLVAALKKAFDGTGQPGSALPILYDSVAVAAAVPAAKAALYQQPAAPLPTPPRDETAQAAAYRQELETAFCQPTVAGFFLRQVVDDAALGQGQAGLAYPDLSAKASRHPFELAALAARRGALAVCPGLQPAVAPIGMSLPVAPVATANTRWSVGAGCVRDCLYLATLVHLPDGKPVLATQGILPGGDGRTVTLPARTIPPGTYAYVVQLTARYGPGALATVQGDSFTVS